MIEKYFIEQIKSLCFELYFHINENYQERNIKTLKECIKQIIIESEKKLYNTELLFKLIKELLTARIFLETANQDIVKSKKKIEKLLSKKNLKSHVERVRNEKM